MPAGREPSNDILSWLESALIQLELPDEDSPVAEAPGLSAFLSESLAAAPLHVLLYPMISSEMSLEAKSFSAIQKQ